MPLASSSRAQVRYIPESVLGVTPTTGNPRNLRVTGESLDYAVTKEDSKEIRKDRQVGSMTLTGAEASGDLQFELSYAEYDPLLEGALFGTYVPFGIDGVGAAFDATYAAPVLGDGGTITADLPTTGASAFTNLLPGQWFRLVSGSPSDVNYGALLRVHPTVAPTSTVLTLDEGSPIVAGTALGVQIQSSRLANDVTKRSFSLEKEFSDVSQFLKYSGMVPSKVALSVQSRSLITGSFSFMGTEFEIEGSTMLPGVPQESKPYEITNSSSGVGRLWENGAPIVGTFIKTLSLDVDNSLRGNDALGFVGFADISDGTLKVSGSLEMYFANRDLYERFLRDIETQLVFSIQDGEGNGYVFTLPKVNLSSGQVTAGARDQDVMASFDFMALSDDANAIPALRKTIIIDRVGDAVPAAF